MPEIYSVRFEEMGPEWQEVVGRRKLASAVVYDYGEADSKIVLMEFSGRKEGNRSFEVGEGACMRPYYPWYKGRSANKAAKIWLRIVTH